jgi:TolB-like protein
VELHDEAGRIPVRSHPLLSWNKRPGIAVLPFRDLGEDPQQKYFGMGPDRPGVS